MSTLIALKLEQELELTRRAMDAMTRRPKLVLKWGIDSETGRPEAYWAAMRDSAPASVMFAPDFH